MALLLANLHLLQGDPRSRVPALTGCNCLDCHSTRYQDSDLVLHPVSDAGCMGTLPDSTMLAYRALRMLTSHFLMKLKVISWVAGKEEDWMSVSGQQNCSCDGDHWHQAVLSPSPGRRKT